MVYYKRVFMDYLFVESFKCCGRNLLFWIIDFVIFKIKKLIFNMWMLLILLVLVCFGWKGCGNCGNCC